MGLLVFSPKMLVVPRPKYSKKYEHQIYIWPEQQKQKQKHPPLAWQGLIEGMYVPEVSVYLPKNGVGIGL